MRTGGFRGALLATLVIALLIAPTLSLVSVGQVSAMSEGLTPHDPIYIDGNDDFIPANGVTSGSGTENDPYIIENWVIDASSADGIHIKDTVKHFVIRNCLVENGNSYRGIYLEDVINGKVEKNTCFSNNGGIELQGSKNVILSNNICSGSATGIHLGRTENCTLSNNILTNSTYGIHIWPSSSNNMLTGNKADNNYDGIIIEHSPNNVLRNNTMSKNVWNFGVGGEKLSHFVQDIDTTNKVDGKPIQYLVNQGNVVIDSSWDVGFLGVVSSTNITVRELVLTTKNWNAVMFAYVENSTIENVFASNASHAIDFTHSSNNVIRNSIISSRDAIKFWSSSNNTIINNDISKNWFGITLYGDSLNNTIVNNSISNNSYGVKLHSDNNHIYHNNFINNEDHAYDEGLNYWDDGYPSGGNYWSNHSGEDIDNDGIGDTPYTILGDNNQDRYPLMMPFVPVTKPSLVRWPLIAGVVGAVVMVSVATVFYIRKMRLKKVKKRRRRKRRRRPRK